MGDRHQFSNRATIVVPGWLTMDRLFAIEAAGGFFPMSPRFGRACSPFAVYGLERCEAHTPRDAERGVCSATSCARKVTQRQSAGVIGNGLDRAATAFG
jgi:hypothetical protein